MTPRPGRRRVLLIDNHDSYTGSLHQLLWRATGERPELVQSDALDLGSLDDFSHIVLGPGPGDPQDPVDTGRGLEVLRRARVPVLGVCLGFQQMAVAAGGSVVRAARPAHGVIERVTHDGSALFDGVPAAFDAVRYHSLVVAEPAPFDITARAGDGTPMAGAAPERSWFGVQFHPESIASEHGSRIVDAFLRMGEGRGVARANPIREQQFTQGEPWRLWSERIPALPDAAAIFEACCGGAETAVWLDSAQPAYGMGRWSLLGVPDGPRDHVLAYDAATGSMTRDGAAVRGDVWDALAREIDAHPVEAGDLPFAGGYVGSIGYGAKAVGRSGGGAPDAQLVHLSRFVLLDHERGETHVVAVGPDEDEPGARAWIARAAGAVREVAAPLGERQADPARLEPAEASVTRERYVRDLGVVRSWLEAGDSYEACYTYALRFPFAGSGLDAYRLLRADNPAPYAAYLRLPGREVLSSSPERFLTVTPDGRAETKPIKGTARRQADPARDAEAARRLAADPKTRAENLMIVDLLRNDLGRISEPGSVEVPSLMAVESYATVHQLVTSVRSRLLPGPARGVRAAEALFPPGSMTGAPKQRTVELLDELEAAPRGVYSGVIGMFSRSGAVDLSVVIRTAVLEDGVATIGTGGAITIDSDPDAEADETVAKSAPILRAFGRTHPFA